MKKSSFAGLIFGTISVILFGIGMCMAMLPEWNAFRPGVAIGCVGLATALAGVTVWRKMEHRQPFRVTGRAVGSVLLGAAGALGLGAGMCFTMVWNQLILGIVIGLAGIILLLCLIPVCKGLN